MKWLSRNGDAVRLVKTARTSIAVALLALSLGALLGVLQAVPAARAAAAQPAGVPAHIVTPRATPRATPAPAPTRLPAAIDGLKVVTPDQLPREARETLALIDRGGPFPYRQDGVVFRNRERHLPARPDGYYHEYTVKTPGAPNRGARRIVTGSRGEFYYTADHYATFFRVILP